MTEQKTSGFTGFGKAACSYFDSTRPPCGRLLPLRRTAVRRGRIWASAASRIRSGPSARWAFYGARSKKFSVCKIGIRFCGKVLCRRRIPYTSSYSRLSASISLRISESSVSSPFRSNFKIDEYRFAGNFMQNRSQTKSFVTFSRAQEHQPKFVFWKALISFV